MPAAPLPADEATRLAELDALDLLDTLPEQAYDDLTALAAHIAGTPIALVSLVDDDRQWFKSAHGVEISETPRDLSFCAHAILDPDTLLEVSDASADPRFADNPLVTALGYHFYAGTPLVTPSGHALGTLCVIDTDPRVMTADVREALQALGRQVSQQFELRRKVIQLEAAALVRKSHERKLEQYRLHLEENLAEMAEQSIRDPLTDLYNRRALEDRLIAEMAHHRRSERPVCVLMVDLDHFKQLNDVHGHAAGDEALRQVAKVLSNGVRDGDTAARYGGEEFTIVLSDTPLAGARIAAERLRQAISDLSLDSGPLTASIGLAVAGPGADEPDTILEAADGALYAAKHGGRNLVAVAATEPVTMLAAQAG